MSQRTPPKSKTTPRSLVLAFFAGLCGIRSLDRRPDVTAEGGPAALLHALVIEHLRLLLGARSAVAVEVGGGVVRVGLVPLLVRRTRVAGRQPQSRDGEEKRQAIHWRHGTMPPNARHHHSGEPAQTRVARHAEDAVGTVAPRGHGARRRQARRRPPRPARSGGG